MLCVRRMLGATARRGAAALLLVCVRPLVAGDTYSNPFDVPPREGWTDSTTMVSPSGEQFLGNFGNQSVSLTLTNLRPHTHAVVALDLYVIGAWGGTGAGGGAENRFVVTLDGSQGVMDATFSNDDGVDGRPQTYPSQNPLVPDRARRGAFQSNTLGFRDAAGRPRDTTYRLVFNVKHSAETMTLTFSGAGLPADPTILWGVDNVYVSTYTMDLDPVPGLVQAAGGELGGVGSGFERPGLGANPVQFDPIGGDPGDAPSATPEPDPVPRVPAPGSATLLGLAAWRLMGRPRRASGTGGSSTGPPGGRLAA